MGNRKVRRSSGRKYYDDVDIDDGDVVPYDYYWDDWVDRRDGVRDCSDRSRVHYEYSYSARYSGVSNYRLKRRERIRRSRLESPRNQNI